VAKTKNSFIWLGWALFYPLLFYVVAYYFPPEIAIWDENYLVFLVVAIAVSFYPIKINGASIFLINTVSIATFLVHGLLLEMVLTNVGLVIAMLRVKIGRDQHYRYAQNMLCYQIQSISAGLSYYVVDPYMPSIQFYGINIFSALCYLLVFLTMNQLLLHYSHKLLTGFNFKPFEKSFWFSMSASIYTIPAAILMVFLYDSFHNIGVIIVGITVVTVSLSFHYYYESKTYQQYLADAHVLNQYLHGHYTRSTLIDAFMEQLPHVFSVDQMIAFEILEDDSVWKIRVLDCNNDGKLSYVKEPVNISEKSILFEAWKTEKVIVRQESVSWIKEDLKGIVDFPAESVIVLPVKRNKRVTGIFLIMNQLKNAFHPSEVDVSKVLHNYYQVALENARYIEQMEEKAEIDYLTQLPNYRGLERMLADFYSKKEETSSLIVVDLDHFKIVNDEYGHEAGNELLVQVAKLFEQTIQGFGKVARFGGEEFVFFLPEKSKEEAMRFAEVIRQALEKSQITVTNYISDERESITIKITGSFGVANYPEDVLDVKDLMTTADHAMYTGAKRKGRNKVSSIHGEE
jgi:diguanylate cyclase (GGDEF)-like protein